MLVLRLTLQDKQDLALVVDEVTYAEHGKENFTLTSTGGPNWYNIYTKGGLINKDIALAFKKVGFR